MSAGEIPDNPYPGLRPFQADETHLFFGRDEQRVELLRRLRQSRFLAIVGTSGSGKSSLVRAGLLPGLYGGFMSGQGSQWRIVDMRPGTDPIGNLARALDRPGALRDEAQAPEESFTEATLRRSGLGLVQAVREARLNAGDRVLVLVDQFEELFRSIDETDNARAGDDASAFVKLLLEAGQQDELPIFVVLTMRSDFLGECARFRDLPEAINDGQYLIPRLTRDQRREAITGPAAVHGVSLSPTLVNRLLNDVGENPDQLPILQHALMRTWDLWARSGSHGKTIDLPDYERIGGMSEALSRHADTVLEELTHGADEATASQRKLIAERLFKALTAMGASGREVRRLAKLHSIAEIAGASVDEVITVVEAFRAPRNAFLMPPVGEPLSADSTIDISHESLIRNWTTLRRWVEEEAESARNYERLATTAALKAKGEAGLWGQPELGIALAWREQQRPNRAWAQRYHGDFSQAMNFLDDSNANALADVARRRRRKRRLTAAALAVLLLMLTGTLSWVANDIERAGTLDEEAQKTLSNLKFVEGMYDAYLERRGSGADGAAPERCIQLPEDSEPKWHKRMFEQVCNGDGDQQELGQKLKVLHLIYAGNIDDAFSGIRALHDGQNAMTAFTLLQRVADMQPRGMRSELRILASRPAGSGKPPYCDSPEKFVFKHPVHRRIADALCNGLEHTKNERRLVATYKWQLANEQRLMGKAEVLFNKKGEEEPGKEGDPDSNAQNVQEEIFKLNEDNEASLRAYNVDWVYLRIARNASRPESQLAALWGEAMVLVQTYRWTLLVLLLPFIWLPWRSWRRHHGATFPTRPSAMRRAAAALMDGTIGFGIFALLGTATEQTSVTMGLTSEFADAAPVIIASLAALLYFLFCDAIRFKYCRSLGKILFDLRPVRDAAANRGDIGLIASAKRNAPFILGLILSLFLIAFYWGLISVIFPGLGGQYETASIIVCSLAYFWIFYAFDTIRKARDRWFGRRLSKWILRPMMAVIFPPSWFLSEGGRTLGDRWSGTQVIDADSEESLRIELPPRYIRMDPGNAHTAQVA